MERTYFEVYEKLKKSANYSIEFCEAYKDCYVVSRLNNKVFTGTWSGYSIKPDNDDKSYFTEEGIRGCITGIFTVIDGKVHKLESYNELKSKDKYKEFVYDLYKYIELKEETIKKLESLPEVSDEAKVQIRDHINTLETLSHMFTKY